ncbi:Trafficking protein particle complex subunit 6B, partial [Homalodisca vitripennis]
EVDFSSLEYAGFLSGYRIIERLTKDWPRFKDELETLKFICTDFWSSVYKKQIDNLRTNHQGVYVLQDNAFRFLSRISSGTQYLEHAPRVCVNPLIATQLVYHVLTVPGCSTRTCEANSQPILSVILN